MLLVSLKRVLIENEAVKLCVTMWNCFSVIACIIIVIRNFHVTMA